MNYESFKNDVMTGTNELLKIYPMWRKGQTVFNYIDKKYGVARYVQFQEHIDCFYDDNQIEDFIKASWETASRTWDEYKNVEPYE
jgi:hypothetical protein